MKLFLGKGSKIKPINNQNLVLLKKKRNFITTVETYSKYISCILF